MPKAKRKVLSRKKKTEVWFIFPDIHVPHHDPKALEAALRAHARIKPDYTLLLGDFLDCEIFSKHPRRKISEFAIRNYKDFEVDPANKILDRIQKNTKKHTYYLGGNHEARIEAWSANGGPGGMGIYDLISIEATIINGRKKITYIPYNPEKGLSYLQIVRPSKKMKSGGLTAIHGWSFSKHAAYVHLEKSRSQSIVFGHTHRAQTIVSRDPWTGSPIKAFNPGTLSKLQPLYLVSNVSEWTHGFGLVFITENNWTEYLVGINNGYCVLPDGKEIRV